VTTTAGAQDIVLIDYTNHRGEHRERRILPGRIYFGSTKWHKEPQWLLKAWDLEKNAARDFAMADIIGWRAP
jgi:predicted DNA-binding transcriptional regulator YafY